MDAERVRAIGLAALRGAVLVQGLVLLLVSFRQPSWWLSAFPHAPLGAFLGFGALAGGLRALLARRSVAGTIVVWASMALLLLNLPVALHWGWTMNQLYWYPTFTYGYVIGCAVVLGMVELALEEAREMWPVALAGAAVGGGVLLIYGAVIISFYFASSLAVFTPDTAYRPLRIISSTLVTIGGVLGFTSGVLLVEARRRWPRARSWADGLLSLLPWAVVPVLTVLSVLLCWPEPSWTVEVVWKALGWRGAESRLLPEPAPWYVWADAQVLVLAVHGCVLALVFVVLTAWLARKALRAASRPDETPPAPVQQVVPLTNSGVLARSPVLSVLALVATASFAWQTAMLARPPMERLAAGTAFVVPVYARYVGDGYCQSAAITEVAFSSDGTALWALGYGMPWCWRLRAGGGSLPPEPGVPTECWTGSRREGMRDWRTGRYARIEGVEGRPNDWRVEVVDEKTGAVLARHVLRDVGLSKPVHYLEGDLLLAPNRTFDWRRGQWMWDGDPGGYRSAVVSPDCRHLLVQRAHEITDYDLPGGKRRFTVYQSLVSHGCGFDDSSRYVLVSCGSRQRRYAVSDGREVACRSPWGVCSTSPDGSLMAKVVNGAVRLFDSRGTLIATRYFWTNGGSAVVMPTGQCGGEVGGLRIIEGDTLSDDVRQLPIPPDSPLWVPWKEALLE